MNQTALITGSSKRIGRAISEFLAENGWSILLHYNSSEKDAQELAKKLKNLFPNQDFIPVKANLSRIEEVENLIPEVISKHGAFQLLVNNASVFDSGYILETSSELFTSQMDVNLRAPFFLMKTFAQECKKGNIINFVDTRITANKSDYSAYSLSKKGLWDLTKMAAVEFGPSIRVNAIAPGLTLPPPGKDDDYLHDLAGKIPMKKPGGIEPILRSIEYILNNDHLTGQLLFADGGENLGQNP